MIRNSDLVLPFLRKEVDKLNIQQKTELNDLELAGLFYEAMDLADKETNKIKAKIKKAKNENDKDTLKKIIERYTNPQATKFNPIKERERCIKELNAVRFQKKTLYVYDPDKGFTSDMDVIKGCVADLYRNESVTINQQDEVIKHMARLAPSVDTASRGKFIHFKNGVLNVETLEFKEGVPDSFILHKIPHEYKPDAPRVELLDRVFNEWTKGDKVKTDLLLAWIAYNCLEDSPIHKFVIIKGPRRNGKTVFCNFIQAVVGPENVSGVPMKNLEGNFKTGAFGDKLANIADENKGTDMPESSVLKAVSGQGTIDKESKGKDSVIWNPITKMTFVYNEDFSVKDRSGALKKRLIPIIFDADFSNESTQIQDLTGQLSKEEVIEYFFSIAIPILHKVLKQGYFDLPEDSKKFIEEQDFRNNPIKAFYHFIESGNEVFIEGMDLPIMTDKKFWYEFHSGQIRSAYEYWFKEYSGLEGKPIGSNKFFSDLMKDKNLESYRKKGKENQYFTYYRDIQSN